MAAAVLPTATGTNLEKIESFLNDSSYKEALESSANYNTRLCIERRMRLPFLDSQTGVAQGHSSLFMNKRQRMPGTVPGQIYSYPRQRWRKKRRQYLSMNARAYGRAVDHLLDDDMHSISQVENPALQDTDSKDSQLLLKDEVSKEWFYDEQDMLDMDAYDEPDPDSDLDYEESYSKRNKKRRGTGRGRGVDSPGTPGRRKGSGRGRKKSSIHNFDPTPGDPDKPFACELCGARYKTRPGLTYHYGHSHKEGASDENSREAAPPQIVPPSAAPIPPMGSAAAMGGGGLPPLVGGPPPPHMGIGMPIGGGGVPPLHPNLGGPAMPPPPLLGGGLLPPPSGNLGDALPAPGAAPGNVYQDSYVSFLNHPAGTPGRRGRQSNPPQLPPTQAPPTLPPNLPAPVPPTIEDPPMPVLVPEKTIETPPQIHSMVATMEQKPKAAPSPYCDFCLGDSNENKKTGGSEELVSCSDCGRSGHPTCLQFTANMNISVKKYRWQCIECKCCSVCGTSDNDDQLLFCDDCDRGYHMYCLSPPLTTPPEGSWSCKLCIHEFHK
ncbi:PREDICTED: zinc finger protein ubi-d4 B-like [Nicrophorus vespilloides]|uniref:Zinc finger protein ubi-d4 B-like n=1 Tax=Nicrophorus vespilloides TaxID=110193 RepID=A0ABM1N343_NICVS|nr:PREDICTED: zinc finger protein ubi-d4 B-like [Nicrophorus vespilloides]